MSTLPENNNIRKYDPMNYSSDEKLAIIRVLERMAKANERIAPEEMDFLVKAASVLDIGSEEIYQSKDMPLKNAGKIIESMTDAKKEMLRKLLVEMAVVDGRINKDELKVLIDTFLWVDISSDNSENQS